MLKFMTEAIQTWFYLKHDEIELCVDEESLLNIAQVIDRENQDGFAISSLKLRMEIGDCIINFTANDIFIDQRDYERLFGEIGIDIY